MREGNGTVVSKQALKFCLDPAVGAQTSSLIEWDKFCSGL